MIEQVAAQASFWDLILVAVVIIGVAWFWWSRKAAKYPDYASRKEAQVDEGLQTLITKAGADSPLGKALITIRDANLVKAGQDTYAAVGARLDSLEGKVNEILSRLPKS